MKIIQFFKDRLFVSISIVVILCIFTFLIQTGTASYPQFKHLYLNDGWECMIGDFSESSKGDLILDQVSDLSLWKKMNDIDVQSPKDLYTPDNLPSNRQVVWFKKDLPDAIWDFPSPSIYFENIYAQSLKIYIGSEKVFERKRNWASNTNVVFLPLEQHSGKTIYIRAETPYVVSGPVKNIIAGSLNPLIHIYFGKDFTNIVTGSVIAIVGFMLLFCSAFIRKDHRKSWVPLSFICLFIGVGWLMYPNKLNIYYPSLEKYLVIIFDFIIYMLPVSLIYFYEQIFGTGHKNMIQRLRQILTLFSVFCVCVLLLNNIMSYQYNDFYNLLRGSMIQWFYLVVVSMLIGTSIYFAVKGNTDARIFSSGVAAFILSIILDLIIMIFFDIRHQFLLAKWGIVIFITLLVSILGRRIALNYTQVITYSKELETKNELLDNMWKEVKASRDDLAHLNTTLEQRIQERTKELELANEELTAVNEELHSSNDELMTTLEILRKTQAQLIESEKMAALGQLVAGVAHEINTPIGAIRASVENISESLYDLLQKFPLLPRLFAEEKNSDFFIMLKNALQNPFESLSSREERSFRRNLYKQLESNQVADPSKKADMLVSMGIFDIMPYLYILKNADSDMMLKTIYTLSGLQRSAKIIKEATERTSKVIFALRSYSHFDHLSLMIPADIREGVDTVLTLYHNRIKGGVNLVRNYRDIESILCYPDELNQVWTNLISNALQAMDYKGTLIVDISETREHVVVSFTDNGTGIPDEIKSKIFNPFFTTKPQGEGSGLGLDIVRRIIDKHNGKIEMDSVPGKTVFSVYIPRTHNETN